ncbi:MAG: ferrochelatase [Nitrospiria bacterium]
MQKKIAVLLMAHGAPESLNDIGAYLQHIMKGRPPAQAIVDQVKERYALVGGKSPLLSITQQQADALEVRLNDDHFERNVRFQVYVGMRHWHPFIADTVKAIVDDPPEALIALSLAPQYSKLSVGAYNETLKKALTESGSTLPVHWVKSWHNQPHLIDAFSDRLKAALEGYAEDERASVQIVFTAHSLPAEVLADGDPYPNEVMGTMTEIVKKCDLGPQGTRWRFGYQSRGFRPGEWLGPEVDDIIEDLGNRGEKNLLIVPIGFVSDHVEILYDIDILYKDMAASKGIRLQRTESLNIHPSFIKALSDLVCSKFRV